MASPEYVKLLTSFVLTDSVKDQYSAFERGFKAVTDPGDALALFAPVELELSIRGSTEEIDVDQLRGITVYEGFNPSEPTIESVAFA